MAFEATLFQFVNCIVVFWQFIEPASTGNAPPAVAGVNIIFS